MKSSLIVLVLICLIFSCQKQEIGPQYEDSNSFGEGKKVLILNEGNFGWGNASISVYKPNEETIFNNQFLLQNGYNVGDVIQSAIRLNDKYYIVVNNSGVIYECDSTSLEVTKSFNGFTSPRTLLSISNNRLLVSDLYSDNISVLNLVSGVIEKTINNVGWIDAMLSSNGKIYAGQADGNKLFVINESSLDITDSILIPYGVNSIQKDVNENIWVLSDGGIGIELPALTFINPANNSIVDQYLFSSTSMSPSQLRINLQGNTLLFLNDGVFRMNIADVNLPNQPIVSGAGKVFYGMNIDPDNNQIYVTDAKDYVQPGTLFRYSATGNIIDSVQTAIIPQAIVF